MSNYITNPLTFLQQQITRLPLIVHATVAFGAFMLLGFSNSVLDASYAESLFPVPYAVGQTTFDGELLKSYYQFMIDQDTLGIYWRTQFIDFGFIASMFIVGLLIPTLLRRIALLSSWGYSILTVAGILIPLGAIIDTIENLNSFIMLAQPQTFANWLALPYSTFAVIKFGCIGLGMLAMVLGLAVAILERGWRWMKPAQMAIS